MYTIVNAVKNYWTADNTNIFRDYKDALAGSVVLVGLPALSILLAIWVEVYTFLNYTFPLSAVSLAGLYDTYGRYEGKSPKNLKLIVRTVLHALAIFFAALCAGMKNKILPYIAPSILCLCGILLV